MDEVSHGECDTATGGCFWILRVSSAYFGPRADPDTCIVLKVLLLPFATHDIELKCVSLIGFVVIFRKGTDFGHFDGDLGPTWRAKERVVAHQTITDGYIFHQVDTLIERRIKNNFAQERGGHGWWVLIRMHSAVSNGMFSEMGASGAVGLALGMILIN